MSQLIIDLVRGESVLVRGGHIECRQGYDTEDESDKMRGEEMGEMGEMADGPCLIETQKASKINYSSSSCSGSGSGLGSERLKRGVLMIVIILMNHE